MIDPGWETEKDIGQSLKGHEKITCGSLVQKDS